MNDFFISGVVILLAFVITVFLGKLILPQLIKLKVGQSIREEGPESHMKKNGTPVMGGLMFLATLIISYIVMQVFYKGNVSNEITVIVFATIGFGVIGFLDDYIKVVKKQNLGLNAKQKLLGQILITVFVVLWFYFNEGSEIEIPFAKIYVEMVWLYVPFMALVLAGTVNAVNLTDGLDGLSSGVTVVVMVAFMIVSIIKGRLDIALISSVLAGGCLGFLVYNHHPAKVFMGDVGSLALGGAVATIAMALKSPFLIPLAGMIYFAEAISVILQVASFKLRGKRIFKMAPLHHHFELCGWSEIKVVYVFRIVTLIMSIVAILAIV
ncbi:MAG: phospho-N-acetylmuramoyl-pentapeptide-transferase [Tissierellales bacterium]|jgi:phospho-N-acetylmuramoyl-pentapeptide-transferase|nr:phospho-N-acetylmuramoyl-pentapeptide-transferase [Tissierellales bacterium]